MKEKVCGACCHHFDGFCCVWCLPVYSGSNCSRWKSFEQEELDDMDYEKMMERARVELEVK